jgi:hypothetical protein
MSVSPALSIYHLKAKEHEFDEPLEFVVLALDAPEARRLARLAHRRSHWTKPKKETGDKWLDPARTTVRRDPAGHPHVLLMHWHAG